MCGLGFCCTYGHMDHKNTRGFHTGKMVRLHILERIDLEHKRSIKYVYFNGTITYGYDLGEKVFCDNGFRNTECVQSSFIWGR